MFTVRRAVAKDIPRLLELYHQLNTTKLPAESERSVEDYQRIFREIESFKGMELVVAEDGGDVMGSLVLIIVPNLSHSGLPWAVVENVIVDQTRRGQGIGRDMMKYAEARAREAGCYKIGLSSDNSRKEAHEFYRSLGYRATAAGFRLYL